jgi:hypothetical protein
MLSMRFGGNPISSSLSSVLFPAIERRICEILRHPSEFLSSNSLARRIFVATFARKVAEDIARRTLFHVSEMYDACIWWYLLSVGVDILLVKLT